VPDDDDDDLSDEDDFGISDSRGTNVFMDMRSAMSQFYVVHKCTVKCVVLVVLIVLYFIYFSYAMYYKFGDEGSIRLLWVTCLVVAILLLKLIARLLHPQLRQLWSSRVFKFIRRHRRQINWCVAYMLLYPTVSPTSTYKDTVQLLHFMVKLFRT